MNDHEKPETDETKLEDKPEEKSPVPAPPCPNCGEALGSEKCLANCGVQV